MSGLICDHEWAVKLTPTGRLEVCKRCGKTRTPADGWSCAGCGKGSSHSCECATKSLARPSSDGGREYRWKDQQVALAPAPVAGDAVESIAIALWHRFAPDDRIEWEEETEKAIYRDAAQQVAALAQDRASQAAAAGVPEGWRLVPVLPTLAMLEQIKLQEGFTTLALTNRYRAMLAAAPSAPAQGAEREVPNG